MRKLWQHKGASCKVQRVEGLSEHAYAATRQIVDVWTEPAQRQQGHATELLNRVCKIADRYEIALVVVPQEFGDSNGLPDLCKWYSKHKFKTVEEHPKMMVRLPIGGN
jgi:GNAT superfamily N-acetyltransferase